MANENLIKVLLMLAEKVPYLSEVERDDAMDLLREVEHDVGAEGVIPPKSGDTNAPLAAPADLVAAAPDPGPVATPPPPGEQLPPPVTFGGTEIEGTGEAGNAFSG